MEWTERYRIDAPVTVADAPATAAEAVRKLTAGNERFVAMRRVQDADPADARPTGPRSFASALAPVGEITPQAPFAVIFSCADARVPAEIVFDTGPNRLFVVRVAGSVPGEECVGSIEYAVKSFRDTLKVVAVIGHTRCGAVTAAVSSYLNPKGYGEVGFTRGLRAIVNHVLVAVRSAALSLTQVWGADVVDDPGFEAALAETAVFMNASITAYQLQKELDPGDPPVVFGVYDLATSKVGLPGDPNGYVVKLSPAPESAEQLVELGREIAASNAVRVHFRARRLPPRKPAADPPPPATPR